MSGLSNSEIAQEMTTIEKAWDAIPELTEPIQRDTARDRENGEHFGIAAGIIIVMTVIVLVASSAALLVTELTPGIMKIVIWGAGSLGLFMLWSATWIITGKECFGLLQVRVLQRKKYQQIAQKEWLEYEADLRKYNKQQAKLAKKKKTVEAQAQKIADEFNIGSLEKRLRFTEGHFSAEEIVTTKEPMDKNLTLLNDIKG